MTLAIEPIQEAVRESGVDGWLFFDHHRRDEFAYRILHLPKSLRPSRRWYYFIPAVGEPQGLAHRIESHALDGLPGQIELYARWEEHHGKLKKLLRDSAKIAMQYSPECAIPTISIVDAGTVDVLRGLGIDVTSSADLIQRFEACWTGAQHQSHLKAGKLVDAIRAEAFRFAASRIHSGITEWDVHCFVRDRFSDVGLITDHGPVVAVNANASDPHYEPTADRHHSIRTGDLLLIDMWAKLAIPDSVYYDITWTAVCGQAETRPEVMRVFDIVKQARDNAFGLVKERISNRQQLRGFEVDDAARNVITHAGFGDQFIHRTGHSIGEDPHGAGANMDNFETHDERSIIPNTCFSIEPGVYLPTFGVRSEFNVFVGPTEASITGEVQRELLSLSIS